jgi:hypothetical protein
VKEERLTPVSGKSKLRQQRSNNAPQKLHNALQKRQNAIGSN